MGNRNKRCKVNTNIYYFLCQVNNVLSIIQWSRPSVPGYSWGKEWRWSEVPTVKYFFLFKPDWFIKRVADKLEVFAK